MNRFLIFLLGLIALGLLTYFCIRNHTPAIEQDLVSRTSSALSGSDMDWATVNTDGRELVLTGVAPTSAQRDRADEIAARIHGVRTVDNQMTVAAQTPETVAAPTPYETQFSIDGTRIVLSGQAQDKDSRDRLVRLAKDKVGGENVIDQLELAPGAPDGWHAAALVALEHLGQFNRGSATLVDTELDVSGEVAFASVGDRVKRQMENGLPGSFGVSFDIAVAKIVPEPEEPKPEPVPEPEDVSTTVSCQERLDRLLVDQRIHFETGISKIHADSFVLLDSLVDVTSDCPDSRIEIAGHTDSDGSEAFNQRLSLARAESVLDYLINKGIHPERLTAAGYGESRPIVDNDTEEGRAQNRRIELTVQGN